MKWILGAFLPVAVALAGCAPGAGPADAAAAAPPPTIALRLSSWGQTMLTWTISADGTGSYTEAEGVATNFRNYTLVTRRLDAGTAGYAEIRTLLASTERHAGNGIACTLQITDQAYGRVSWNGVETPFNFGCRSKDADAMIAGIEKANGRLKILAANGDILNTEQIGSPQ
ncbi:hypothetical protein [Sphingomonas sanxanigenens]|nr:hypothetical protein [Sphingomonas sanxanigenens]